MTDRKKTAAMLASIAAVVFLSYFNALYNTFAWDDVSIVLKNRYIKDLGYIPTLFSLDYWAPNDTAGGLYRPLSMLTFMLEYMLAGTNPLIYHMDNIVLHFLCSMLVFFLLRTIFKEDVAPFFAALLFAAHPVHTEVVASVVGRLELLATLFVLLGLYTYIRPPKRIPWYIVSPFFYLLGLFSKETAVTLPGLLLLYLLLIEGEKRLKAIFLAMAPYAVALALYLPFRFNALVGGASPPHTIMRGIEPLAVFTTMMKSLLIYIRLSLFPTDLRVIYIFAPPDSVFSPEVLIPVGLLLAVGALAPWLIRRRKVIIFFLLWFLAALLPVSNIIPTEVLLTERAMYLPSIGFCALLGYAFSVGVQSRYRHMAASLLVVVLLSYSALCINRNGTWKDNNSVHAELTALNTRLIKEYPDFMLGFLRLGQEYVTIGRPEMAVDAFKEVLRNDPDDNEARLSLAIAYMDMREPRKSLETLEGAGVIEEEGASNYYTYMGIASFKLGERERSESYLKKAMELDPKNSQPLYNYGILLLDGGDKSSAFKFFQRASELTPKVPGAFFELGALYGERGDYTAAVDSLEKAVKLEPEDPKYRLYLGAAYELTGARNKALSELEEALRLRPDYPEALQLYRQLS